MPFPMKIQPLDVDSVDEITRNGSVKPAGKSRFKRLFERQLPSVLRTSTAEKITGAPEPHLNKDVSVDLDPSSVCLAHMVQNFLEGNDKQAVTVRHGRNLCNCFNGSNNSSEDELDSCNCFRDSNFSSSGDACEVLKSLVPCASVSERNLLADTSKIVEKNKISKRKDDYCRKIVRDGLLALGCDVSICKSRWEKSPSHPAGEYEYVDVITEGERLIIDIDFRSEFEIARPTKSFKAILQTLPVIFVGKADRLQRIVSLVSEAAGRSLKKRGMPFPPWRKAEYVIAKWLAPYTRINSEHNISQKFDLATERKESLVPVESSSKLFFGEDLSPCRDGVFTLSDGSGEREKTMGKEWEPPEIKPKNSNVGLKIMTGLASVMEEKP